MAGRFYFDIREQLGQLRIYHFAFVLRVSFFGVQSDVCLLKLFVFFFKILLFAKQLYKVFLFAFLFMLVKNLWCSTVYTYILRSPVTNSRWEGPELMACELSKNLFLTSTGCTRTAKAGISGI